MSEDRPRTSQFTQPPPSNGSSRATRLIGSVTFVVVLAALALFLDEPQGSPPMDPTPGDTSITPSPVNSEKPVPRLAPSDPLDLTDKFIDSSKRARLWNGSAILAGIELIVADGKPEGPVAFTYGVTTGQPIPGAVLSPKRRTILYSDDEVTSQDTVSTKIGMALPEPRCPIEVAHRKLPDEAGEQKLGVMYLQSDRHGRPIWLFTNSSGDTYQLSGENCVLLRN